MTKFDKKEFGNNIKKARKDKGLSQENLADILCVTRSAITRYENGEVFPNPEQISIICDALNIYPNDLFDSSNNKIINKESSKNPFKTNTLYIYYNAYFPSQKRYGKGKFKIIIHEKYDICLADLVDYKTNKIYLSGHIYSDETIAVFILENYKPNNPRLEVTQIIANIFDTSRNTFFGTLSCTNGNYVPSIRKCIISKTDIDFDDEMLEQLKITDSEKNTLNETNILYINSAVKEDFEN